MMKKILVAGATGLIGNTVIDRLIANGDVTPIALTRRQLKKDARLEQWISTENDLLSALRTQQVDAVICCLGTTIKKAGSRKAFRHVDHDLVIGIGNWAKINGVRTFCVVSAIGADAGSKIFYNKVKGEMERDLKAIGLPVVHIFHPSILTGPRQEVRIGERIGIVVMGLISPLLIGPLERYRSMPHDMLATALINATDLPHGGTYSYEAIGKIALRK